MERRRVVAWLVVFGWTALVFTLSSEPFSARETGRLLEPLLRWLVPGISQQALDAAHFALRKAAHLGEYAVLALLAFRALLLADRRPAAISAALALAYCIGVSAVDETRQHYTPSRTGAVSDVGIDACGSGLALAAALALRRLRPRRVGPPARVP